MLNKNTATYWVNAIKTLQFALKRCSAQNRGDYSTAIIDAEKKLRAIRRQAGVYI